MSALTALLERLRRMRPPPGAPAAVLSVPSAGEDLAGEVAFLFADLDAVQERAQEEQRTAHASAAEIEARAREQRATLLAAAAGRAEREAEHVIGEQRATCDREVAGVLADARREANLVLTRGRRRTPALVAEVVRRVGEQGS